MMYTERISLPSLFTTEGKSKFSEIAADIERGAVFVYPTETIYGIGGRYDRKEVYQRIIDIKRRAPDNPMILIGGDLSCFDQLNLTFPSAAQRCANAFWPGLLTMVLSASTAEDGVAIRVSDHPFITALSALFALPLFSTSANISGHPYVDDPDYIYNHIGVHADFMIDAGRLPPSRPSTVIRFNEDDSVTILREGAVSAEAIYSVIRTGH